MKIRIHGFALPGLLALIHDAASRPGDWGGFVSIGRRRDVGGIDTFTRTSTEEYNHRWRLTISELPEEEGKKFDFNCFGPSDAVTRLEGGGVNVMILEHFLLPSPTDPTSMVRYNVRLSDEKEDLP